MTKPFHAIRERLTDLGSALTSLRPDGGWGSLLRDDSRVFRDNHAAALALIAGVNEARRAKGLDPLEEADDLRDTALANCGACVRVGMADRFVGPATPRGGEMAQLVTSTDEPQQILEIWLGDEPSRAVLLAPRFRECGAAVGSRFASFHAR